MLRRAVGERVHLAQDALAQLVAGQRAVLLDDRAEARLAEEVFGMVHLLAQPVGEEHEQIAACERDGDLLQRRLEPLAIVDAQPEHHAVRHEDVSDPLARRGAGG